MAAVPNLNYQDFCARPYDPVALMCPCAWPTISILTAAPRCPSPRRHRQRCRQRLTATPQCLSFRAAPQHHRQRAARRRLLSHDAAHGAASRGIALAGRSADRFLLFYPVAYQGCRRNASVSNGRRVSCRAALPRPATGRCQAPSPPSGGKSTCQPMPNRSMQEPK